MNFAPILESLPLYLSGLLVTLKLLLIALVAGFVAALPLSTLRASHSPWARLPVWAFTYVVRGTPLLVQLFLVYYGLAQFESVRESVLWPWLQSATFCACVAFGINTCGYTTEILAGAITATPVGEVEAARAMGLSRTQVLRRIVLPGALRRAIPAYGNEVVLMLHGTSLASVVTLLDLTGAAREVNSRHYLPFEAFLTAGAIYLCLTLAIVALVHLAERRWLAHLRART
ncbi:MAG TPA: ABC transporter permease [Burkholderiaceae bacterium]|jgi:arginine/ornithine transport system permease protein|nr:ABC transporter permease [Burkholderiaceae bacterium]